MIVLAPGLARFIAEALHYNDGGSSNIYQRLRLYNGTADANHLATHNYYTDANTFRHRNPNLSTGPAVGVNSSSSLWNNDAATILLNYANDATTNAFGTPASRISFLATGTWSNLKYLSYEIQERSTNADPGTADRQSTSAVRLNVWRELFRFTMPGNGDGNQFGLEEAERVRIAGLFVRCYTGAPVTTFKVSTISSAQTVTSAEATALVGVTQHWACLDEGSLVEHGPRVPIEFYRTGDRLYYSGPVVLGEVSSGTTYTRLLVYTASSGGSPYISKNITPLSLTEGDVPFLDQSATNQYFTVV